MPDPEIPEKPYVSIEAERIFAAWLSRRRGGATESIEDLCGEHEDIALQLSALHRDWLSLEAILDRLGATATLSERLQDHYGAVNPKIDLERASGTGSVSGHADMRLKKLAAHTPPETRYRVEGEIARGAMGVVYKVFDEDIRRNLAMKVVMGRKELPAPAERVVVDPQRLGRFLEEAQVTGQLDHPGIVPVHELGLDHNGRAFFTMRLVRGVDFRTIIDAVHDERDGWTLTRALTVLQRVCEAVAFAHSKQVIHRDIKPSNVMVGRFGETYVMDWGLAKVLGRKDIHDIRLREDGGALSVIHTDRVDESATNPESPLVTMDGDVVGTPAYMAPEQASGRVEEVGVRSDVYSVGAMLYHLLTGERPYVGKGDRVSPHTVLAAVRGGPPKPVHSLRSDVPAELEAICSKAMARDPAERYADMLEMEQDLRAYLENRVVRAYRTGAWVEFKKWTVRNRGLAAALATLIFAIIAGLTSTAVVFAVGKRKETLLAEAERAARTEAEQNAKEAAAQEIQVRKANRELLPFGDLGKINLLRRKQEAFWPPQEHVAAMRTWLGEAQPIASRIDHHRKMLATHRQRALPYSDEQRAADRTASTAELQELEELFEVHASLTALVERSESELASEYESLLSQNEARTEELEQELLSKRTYEYEDIDDQAKDSALAEIVAECETFAQEIEWMRWRLKTAENLELMTLSGAEAIAEWSKAIADVASSPVYGGLVLQPTLGLLPLAKSSQSGLWEFWHVCTGEKPVRDPTSGEWRMQPETGMVFVLIPGGTFWMGTSAPGSGLHNEDADHQESEGPPVQLDLAPYFLSKYEMTRGQWRRIMGSDPSRMATGDQTPELHPVVQVNYDQACKALARVGLRLPSEAQWEYAARGGTSTPNYAGSTSGALAGFENVYDDRARYSTESRGTRAGFNDSFAQTSPVGFFRPNPFGLYDVLGNVCELCLDKFLPSLGGFTGRPRDHLRAPPEKEPFEPSCRGGSWYLGAEFSRVGSRLFLYQQDTTSYMIGVRAGLDL